MRPPRTPHPPQIRQEGPACPCPRGGRRLPDVGQPDDADLEGRPEPADDGVRLHPVACLLRRHLGRQSRAQQIRSEQSTAEQSAAKAPRSRLGAGSPPEAARGARPAPGGRGGGAGRGLPPDGRAHLAARQRRGAERLGAERPDTRPGHAGPAAAGGGTGGAAPPIGRARRQGKGRRSGAGRGGLGGAPRAARELRAAPEPQRALGAARGRPSRQGAGTGTGEHGGSPARPGSAVLLPAATQAGWGHRSVRDGRLPPPRIAVGSPAS